MAQNDLGFGGDYLLSLFNVPKSLDKKLLEQGAAMTYIDEHGTSLGDEIPFPPGKVFYFFECLHDLTTLDLLHLIGVNAKIGSVYPHEDEICCGTTEPEVLLVLVAKLTAILEVEKSRCEAMEKAKSLGLDPEWFLRNCDLLRKQCEKSLNMGGSIVSIFE